MTMDRPEEPYARSHRRRRTRGARGDSRSLSMNFGSLESLNGNALEFAGTGRRSGRGRRWGHDQGIAPFSQRGYETDCSVGVTESLAAWMRPQATRRTAASAKSRPARVKKAVRKERREQSVAPAIEAIETIAVEVIEQPAPGVIAVTKVEETEVRPGSE